MAGTTSPTRKWLMLQPRPAKVRLHLPGGSTREVSPSPSMSWAKLANTIDALTPTVLEALDPKGELLRARNLEQVAEEGEPDEPPEDVDPTSPLEGDGPLETFARLLADAHRVSGERAFSFVETAFRSMVEMHNLNVKQLASQQAVVEGMQKQWRRAYEERMASGGGEDEEGGEGAVAGGNLLLQMLGQFVASGGLNGLAPPTGRVNGAANGAVKPKE